MSSRRYSVHTDKQPGAWHSLQWSSVPASLVAAAIPLHLPAVLTPLRRITEPLLMEELLLACRPGERASAINVCSLLVFNYVELKIEQNRL